MKMKRELICFIILHYMNIFDTIECLESITNLEYKEFIRIVVIDNASPDGSGIVLKKRYLDNSNIHVICKKNNEGFSRGNNEGVRYAKKRWNPDFYVVTNNDVLFLQRQFYTKVLDSYAEFQYDIMGPDIYVPHYHIHQNPMRIDPPSLIQVQKTIFLHTVFELLFPIIYRIVADRHELGRKECSENYLNVQKDICLKGACMIYSKKYVEEREILFYPETFLYYEEFIQTIYCRKNSKKVIYDPNLQVIHKDGASIIGKHKETYKHCKFIIEVTKKSAQIYKKYLLRLRQCQTKR